MGVGVMCCGAGGAGGIPSSGGVLEAGLKAGRVKARELSALAAAKEGLSGRNAVTPGGVPPLQKS